MKGTDRAERVESGVRSRLTDLCSHMPQERFEEMVRDITANEMKTPYYGLPRDGASKDDESAESR